MGKNAYIGISSKAKKIKNIYVGVGGVAKKVKKAYIGVGGKAKLFWSSSAEDPETIITFLPKTSSKTVMCYSKDQGATWTETTLQLPYFTTSTKNTRCYYDKTTEYWILYNNNKVYKFKTTSTTMTELYTPSSSDYTATFLAIIDGYLIVKYGSSSARFGIIDIATGAKTYVSHGLSIDSIFSSNGTNQNMNFAHIGENQYCFVAYRDWKFYFIKFTFVNGTMSNFIRYECFDCSGHGWDPSTDYCYGQEGVVFYNGSSIVALLKYACEDEDSNESFYWQSVRNDTAVSEKYTNYDVDSLRYSLELSSGYDVQVHFSSQGYVYNSYLLNKSTGSITNAQGEYVTSSYNKNTIYGKDFTSKVEVDNKSSVSVNGTTKLSAGVSGYNLGCPSYSNAYASYRENP